MFRKTVLAGLAFGFLAAFTGLSGAAAADGQRSVITSRDADYAGFDYQTVKDVEQKACASASALVGVIEASVVPSGESGSMTMETSRHRDVMTSNLCTPAAVGLAAGDHAGEQDDARRPWSPGRHS